MTHVSFILLLITITKVYIIPSVVRSLTAGAAWWRTPSWS